MRRLAFPSCVLLIAGCTGTIAEPGASDPAPPRRDDGPQVAVGASCETTSVPQGADVLIDHRPTCAGRDHVAISGLRHLTTSQYQNTVAELLGIDSAIAEEFVDTRAAGFRANAGGEIGGLEVTQYQQAAEALASRVNVEVLAGCDATDESCIDPFIREFGRRAFRRALNVDEQQSLATLARQAPTFEQGLRWVIEAVLQMPSFLYHSELGLPSDDDDSLRTLTSIELGPRISYLIVDSMPDEALLDQAESGALLDGTVRAAEARRLLSDPRANRAIRSFFEQWLSIDAIHRSLAAAEYPELTDDLASAFREETLALIEDVVLRGDGRLGTLLRTQETILPPALVQHYGFGDPDADGRIMAPPDRRAGILTHGSWLLANGRPGVNPVARGKLIREMLLCQSTPAPPEGVAAVEEQTTSHSNPRERWCEHSRQPACGGCHAYLDPLGWPFEQLDHLGRWRTTIGDWTIDASGAIAGTDVDATVNGPIQMAQRLAESEQVKGCFVMRWMSFALGRPLSDDDGCAFQEISRRFVVSGGDIRALIVDVVASDAFAVRRVEQ